MPAEAGLSLLRESANAPENLEIPRDVSDAWQREAEAEAAGKTKGFGLESWRG